MATASGGEKLVGIDLVTVTNASPYTVPAGQYARIYIMTGPANGDMTIGGLTVVPNIEADNPFMVKRRDYYPTVITSGATVTVNSIFLSAIITVMRYANP